MDAWPRSSRLAREASFAPKPGHFLAKAALKTRLLVLALAERPFCPAKATKTGNFLGDYAPFGYKKNS
jgi:hypothetical protein